MKMVKKFAALACSAVVAFGLMSCHTNDIGNGMGPTPKTDVPVNVTKTLIVKLSRALNAGETLKYNGATGVVSGTTVTFENVADGKTLVLSGGNLIEQSTTISFGDGNVVAIDLDVLEETPGITIQDVTSESDPDQEANDNLDGAEASIAVKAGAIMNNSSLKGKKFSITLYTPAVSPLKEIKEGADEAKLLAAKCNPLGATFNPAVAFEANLPGAQKCDIVCYNVNEGSTKWPASEPTKLTAELSSFTSTDPVISLKYEITSIKEEKKAIADGAGTVPAGSNIVSYKENYGYRPLVQTTGVISRLFRQLFGTAFGVTTKSFTLETKGETNYVLYQNVKTVTIKSGTADPFVVEIYGGVTADLISVEPSTDPEIVPGHNGGSND